MAAFNTDEYIDTTYSPLSIDMILTATLTEKGDLALLIPVLVSLLGSSDLVEVRAEKLALRTTYQRDEIQRHNAHLPIYSPLQ